jgi:hypothetical protein
MKLSWAASRVALGHLGDTIIAINLSKAEIERLVWEKRLRRVVRLSTLKLPRYFISIPSEERYFDPPNVVFAGIADSTIQELADPLYVLIDQPQLAAGTTDSEGRAYVIRNIEFTWIPGSIPGMARPPKGLGTWKPTSQALEIYESTGRLLGAFRLPVYRPTWIRVDDVGRIFIDGMSQDSGGEHVVAILANPLSPVLCGESAAAVDLSESLMKHAQSSVGPP